MDTPKQKIGQLAETKACDFLKKQGLKLLDSNFRCKVGEIDLIMRDGTDIVFVEVRARRDRGYGTAIESITPFKQRKIIKTAVYYMQRKKWLEKVGCRFDVIGIDTTIEWIKSAFSIEGYR